MCSVRVQGLGNSVVWGWGSNVRECPKFQIWVTRFGKLQGLRFGLEALCIYNAVIRTETSCLEGALDNIGSEASAEDATGVASRRSQVAGRVES